MSGIADTFKERLLISAVTEASCSLCAEASDGHSAQPRQQETGALALCDLTRLPRRLQLRSGSEASSTGEATREHFLFL